MSYLMALYGRTKLENVLSAILMLAWCLLSMWSVLVIFYGQESGEISGYAKDVYVENGITKIEFITDNGKKEVYEYAGKKEVQPEKNVKLKFFKFLFQTPKAIEISK